MKRKLSRRAKTAKKKRDLKYANSRSREIKRADSQKKRRAARNRVRRRMIRSGKARKGDGKEVFLSC